MLIFWEVVENEIRAFIFDINVKRSLNKILQITCQVLEYELDLLF